MDFKEQKIVVKMMTINYVTAGRGRHPILLLPGAPGSIWSDFKPQVFGLDKDEFTIIGWDPPGYGESRPPNRNYGENFLADDASVARDFMKAIGFEKFSVIGWCNGGITAIFLAANYPDSVEKMIVIGANSYISPEDMQMYEHVRNIDTWSKRMREPLMEIYGDEYFRSMWSAWVDAMAMIYEKKNGDICTKSLRDVKCPTLIVHGAKDVMVHQSHSQFLAENIEGSEMAIFENGGHTLHLQYYEDFNSLAMEFLLGNYKRSISHCSRIDMEHNTPRNSVPDEVYTSTDF